MWVLNILADQFLCDESIVVDSHKLVVQLRPRPHLQNKLAGSPHCRNDFVGKEISYLSFSVKSKRSGCGDTELSYKDANDISAVFVFAPFSYFNGHKVISIYKR